MSRSFSEFQLRELFRNRKFDSRLKTVSGKDAEILQTGDPNSDTGPDFIFTVIGEEFGFVGAGVTLLVFGALFFRGIRIAELVKTKFASLSAIGITSVLLFHVFINIGMNINLAPIVGIPLPFISYGGSSILADWMMVGILLNFYAHRKEH